MQNLIFGPALFYDIPEYLQIVNSHTFWQVFSLGHFPIHPIFLGILWVFIRILPVNVIAMFFGAASIFILFKIAKLIFKKDPFWLPVVIFALLPAVWLINTNLMVESMTLAFYLLSIYFFLLKKPLGFFLSVFLMIGTHLQSIFWIPAIFLLPFIFSKEIGFTKKEMVRSVRLAIFAAFSSTLFYLAIYILSGRQISGSGEQWAVYLSSGPLRMIRNAWLTFARGFGSLTIPAVILLLIKKVRSKKEIFAWIIFLAGTSLIAANWQGDFMPRRIVFAGVLLSLAIYKFLGRKSVIIILYLLPIVLANIILYSQGSPFVTPDLPEGHVLLETHYLKPFIHYDGTVLWIGEDGLDRVDGYLKNGKRVFISRQAVTAPYMLQVGNNYHITSLGKIGDSESRFLFRKYVVEKFNGDYELKMYKGKNVSNQAGDPVISYDQSFWGRLARRRIDYGDIGSWIWALATNHRDPTVWTYKDVRGIWYNM